MLACRSCLAPKQSCARGRYRWHDACLRAGKTKSKRSKYLAEPIKTKRHVLVGRGGLEPPTSRLSGVRSNHLSYRPGQTNERNLSGTAIATLCLACVGCMISPSSKDSFVFLAAFAQNTQAFSSERTGLF